MTPLPADLYQAVFDVGYCAVPLRKTPQVDAKLRLFKALSTNDVTAVLEALREFSRAFRRDIDGNHVPERLNVTARKAARLINELEQLVGVRRAA